MAKLTPVQRGIIDDMKAGALLWCYAGGLAQWDDFYLDASPANRRHPYQGARTRTILVELGLIRQKTRHRVTGKRVDYVLTKEGKRA